MGISSPLVMVSAVVSRPKGTGPFPAMILLPTCSGLRQHEMLWATWFNTRGYVSIIVDSLASRGRSNVCREGRDPSRVDIGFDALGALAYARSLPYVDGEHVGVIGWSYGAMAALWIAGAQVTQTRGGGFRAAVAFYPHCGSFSSETAIPVLLLLGEKDDWTPPDWCVSMAESVKARRDVEVELKVYPRATHSFDDVSQGSGTFYLGHLGRYDGEATADAEQRVGAFLRRHVSGPR